MTKLYTGIAGIAACGVAAWLGLTTFSGTPESPTFHRQSPEQYLEGKDLAQLEGEIRTFCSQCHGFPEPELYPASRWPAEVDRALRFHRESGLTEIPTPDTRAILAWYQTNAIDKPIKTEPVQTADMTVLGRPEPGPKLRTAAGVSGVLVTQTGSATQILTTDMMSGRIAVTDLQTGSDRELLSTMNPARIRRCDLDPSRPTEYLIADLGTDGVTDALVGRVLWMHSDQQNPGEFTVTTLAADLGRVADVRSADLDGDGDEDIVVAEFGWDHTGSVKLLENTGDGFEVRTLDKRHGAVEIELADFDADGRMDFLIAMGQEHESIELFRNTGDLKFEVRQLYRANTPAFGISSLEVFDQDGDGDMDVVFTSGDMYDSFYIQDHHGVYLLINDGANYPVTQIAQQYAVLSSTHGDVDDDGDIDLVVGSFIPGDSRYSRTKGYEAVVFYEHLDDGTYAARPLKAGDCSHAAVELADLDGDGDLDLIVGTLHDSGGAPEPGLTIWRNQLQAQRVALSRPASVD